MAYGQAKRRRREEVTLIDVAGDGRLRDALPSTMAIGCAAAFRSGAPLGRVQAPRTSLPGPRPNSSGRHITAACVCPGAGGLSSEQYNAGLYRAWRDFVSVVSAIPHHPPFEAVTLSGPGGIAVAWQHCSTAAPAP